MRFLRSRRTGSRPASRPHWWLNWHRRKLGYEAPPFICPSMGSLPDPRQAKLALDPIKVRIDREGVK